jgi:hypothetical protein
MAPARSQTVNTFEILLTRLRESHDLPVYEAIERLVQAAEATGVDADTLLRMIDRGKTFEEILELIESKMECSQAAA